MNLKRAVSQNASGRWTSLRPRWNINGALQTTPALQRHLSVLSGSQNGMRQTAPSYHRGGGHQQRQLLLQTTAKSRLASKKHHAVPNGMRAEPIKFVPTSTRSYGTIVEDGTLKILDQESDTQDVISGRWLRDHCACTECRNEFTGQRQINVLKQRDAGTIHSCAKIGEEEESYEIIFEDGHRSTYSQAFLNLRADPVTLTHLRSGTVTPKLWRADIAIEPPAVEFESLTDDYGMARLLYLIRERGFCLVENSPATPEATEELLKRIGPIRNTHYGGFYDFTADLSSKDTAYTAEALEAHTDTTYFTESIGLQALHMLSHTDGSGGESLLVDGFQAADDVMQGSADHYSTLSSIRVHSHASGNEGISIQPTAPQPVLVHHPVSGHLLQVRWNNADRAGIDCAYEDLDSWYDAATKFDASISDPKNQYWFQLKPGQILIFDNWRILHGRSAFTGKRRMCGGYINRDDFISRYRMTNMSQEDVVKSTVTG